MNLPRLKTVLLTPLVVFALLYIALATYVLLDDNSVPPLRKAPEDPITIAIFGASGTAGDGILKAALASPDIEMIHVITRRVTPRMEAGAAAGKVQVTMHTNYRNFTVLNDLIAKIDTVYWAIGISSVGADEKTYREIHVSFPAAFFTAWAGARELDGVSFHFISSSDISADSSAMWARVKVEAEELFFEVARRMNFRVIAYRPDYIGPTKEEAHIGQDLLYWFFAPVRSAVRATQIGQAMIEVTARGSEFENGRKLGTGTIIRYSDAYEQRQKL